MTIKLIGAVLILSSGSLIGWVLALKYIKRVEEINQLQMGLNLLNAEISYTQTRLDEALRKAGEKLNYPISKLFTDTSHKLSSSPGTPFPKIWIKEVKINFQINSLTEKDNQILMEWGQKIGSYGIEEQKNINQLTLKKLEQAGKNAQTIVNKKVKLIRYAGVLISLMVIILFF